MVRRSTVKRRSSALSSRDENGENTAIVPLSRSSVSSKSPLSKRSKRRTVKKCCSCTRFSTCQTNKCECYASGRICSNCSCYHQCKNLFEKGDDDDSTNISHELNDEEWPMLTQPDNSQQNSNGDRCCSQTMNENSSQVGLDTADENILTQSRHTCSFTGCLGCFVCNE